MYHHGSERTAQHQVVRRNHLSLEFTPLPWIKQTDVYTIMKAINGFGCPDAVNANKLQTSISASALAGRRTLCRWIFRHFASQPKSPPRLGRQLFIPSFFQWALVITCTLAGEWLLHHRSQNRGLKGNTLSTWIPTELGSEWRSS